MQHFKKAPRFTIYTGDQTFSDTCTISTCTTLYNLLPQHICLSEHEQLKQNDMGIMPSIFKLRIP